MKSRRACAIVFAIAVAAMLVPRLAGAQDLSIGGDILLGGAVLPFAKILLATLFLIQAILNYLLRAASAMLNHVTSGDFLAVPITQYPIVQIGWRITRDFANMAFVLVLLYLAFGIILRLPKVNAKQILPKLIGVALLINFSLVIVGFAIDISNRVMLLFLAPITQGDVGGALLSGSHLIETYGSALFSLRLSTQIADIANAVFTIVFTAIITGIFVVLALMFVARLIIFWQIAILAPLAWLSAAIPIEGMNFFGDWFGRLRRWLFWGPKAAFWVFLAVMSARAFQNVNYQQYWAPFSLSKQANLLASIPNALLNAATPILQYIVIITFLTYAINAIREGTGELSKYFGVDKILSTLRKPYQAAWKATGVPGGVKQRWEQIKKSGLKIGGRQLYGGTQAREMREARVAQALGKRGAATRMEASRRIQDVKDLQEGRMATLTNPNLVALLPVHGAPLPTLTEEMAAAAKELLTRRDYFDDIRIRLGHAAEQAEYQHLREVYRRYINP